jgi:hypothetical protein
MSAISTNPQDWPDGLPPCLIHVDKDGQLWHLGAPMVHAGINQIIFDHAELDETGRYIVSFRGQRCFLTVEDTLFVVVRVDGPPPEAGAADRLALTLNDGSREDLDPATLDLSADNILRGRVKNGRFPARFQRAAYYQLAEYVVERDDRFVLPVQGKDWPLA